MAVPGCGTTGVWWTWMFCMMCWLWPPCGAVWVGIWKVIDGFAMACGVLKGRSPGTKDGAEVLREGVAEYPRGGGG